MGWSSLCSAGLWGTLQIQTLGGSGGVTSERGKDDAVGTSEPACNRIQGCPPATEYKGVLKHPGRRAVPGVTKTSMALGQGWGRGDEG